MLAGDSALLAGGSSSGGAVSDDAVAAAAAAETVGGGGASDAAAGGGGGGSNNSGDDERGGGSGSGSGFGGNRWPRQETLALLRIRSDMEAAFREASVKGPLWEQVSRKMAELGYQRSSKKCKEKFENVYKYHKRTKEGRSGKSDGKTYRFFDQLEALEHQSQTPLLLHHQQSPKPPPPPPPTTTPMPPPPPPPTTTHVTTVPSTTIPMVITSSYPTLPPPQPITNPTTATTIPISFPSIPTDLLSNSTSSSTSSDETMEGGRRKNRKRKWKEFFHKLMTEVIEKQEELQKRFLEAVEKRERDRMAREESWRVQEMQRINREREILAQERSIAAQKDAAVMSFLQKIAEQHNLGQALNNTISIVPPQPQAQPQPPPNAAPVQQPVLTAQVVAPIATQPVVLPVSPAVPQQQQVVTSMEMVKVGDNNGEKSMSGSSSRWPKVEVEALIRLRTSMDAKYQENGPKGPLWEEISASMKKLGYNRNPKRCKEKWENINKYFKKVKESNKKRPEDSKTCPYFHQLDALYREKNKLDMAAPKPQSMVAPLMVRPEQQWPPQPMEDAENDPMDEDEDEEEKDIGDEEEDEEDEGGGGNGNGNGGNNYEIVGGKAAATASAE